MAQKIEQLKTTDLIPYAGNTRTHDEKQVAQVAASIKEFGFTNPILVDADNGIIAGHGRLLAAQKLGLEDVPCLRLGHLSDAQRRAYIIADNKLALNAGWDEDALATEIERLLEDGFDLDLTGFGEDEIADFLDQGEKDGLTDDDDVPDASDDLVTINGDIWKMGKHRLLCGDSTSTDDLLKLCEGQLVDMWLTDPPYNVAYEGKTADALTIQNDQMADGNFRDFLRAAYSAADSVMKAGAVFYIWHADSEGYNFRAAAQDINWKVRQCLIWKKSSMVMGRQDYHWMHEPCLYGWKEGAAHLWASDRTQTTVLEFQRPSRSIDHPTMKPVDLFSYQMLNNTKGDDLVLDSFAGSGTTAIVCEKHNRQARIVELDPKYCDVIVRRWQEFTGSKAVNEATGLTFDETEAKMKGNPVNG